MKTVLIAILLWSGGARAESALFVGPIFGETSYSTSSGGTNRDSQSSYGGEGLYVWNNWMGGLSYSEYSVAPTGNSTFNVGQDDKDIEAEIKYRFLMGPLSPFIGLGAGTLIQTVKTSLFEANESDQGDFFIKEVGGGVLWKFMSNFGVSATAEYYQYSNVTGFKYYITLGFFPVF